MALLLQERLPLIQLLTVDHFVCEHYYPLQQDVTRGDFHFFIPYCCKMKLRLRMKAVCIRFLCLVG